MGTGSQNPRAEHCSAVSPDYRALRGTHEDFPEAVRKTRNLNQHLLSEQKCVCDQKNSLKRDFCTSTVSWKREARPLPLLLLCSP